MSKPYKPRSFDYTLEAIQAGKDVDELQVDRDIAELLDRINHIDTVLGSGEIRRSDGTLMPHQEYYEWRANAIHAKNKMLATYRELKEWRKKNRMRVYQAAQKPPVQGGSKMYWRAFLVSTNMVPMEMDKAGEALWDSFRFMNDVRYESREECQAEIDRVIEMLSRWDRIRQEERIRANSSG